MNRIEKIINFSKENLINHSAKEGEAVGWRIEHSEEVYRCSLELLSEVECEFKEIKNIHEILEAACWLHDIEKGKNAEIPDCHAEEGAKKSKKMLFELYDEFEASMIMDMIRFHDKRRPEENEYSNLIKLIQDADVMAKFNYHYVWNKNYEAGKYLSESNLAQYHEKLDSVEVAVVSKLNFEHSKILINRRIRDIKEKVEKILEAQKQ